MNRSVTKFPPAFCSTLLRSASVGLVVLTMFFAASSAKAGCGITSNTGSAPSIPFVSPHWDGHQRQDGEESNGSAAIVGLWHVIYTANFASPSGNFPPTP